MKKFTTILRPVVTEKAAGERSKENTYVFEVAAETNKIEVGQIFNELFGVKPKSVRITKVVKKIRPRDLAVKRQATKRAIITVPAGTQVDLMTFK